MRRAETFPGPYNRRGGGAFTQKEKRRFGGSAPRTSGQATNFALATKVAWRPKFRRGRAGATVFPERRGPTARQRLGNQRDGESSKLDNAIWREGVGQTCRRGQSVAKKQPSRRGSDLGLRKAWAWQVHYNSAAGRTGVSWNLPLSLIRAPARRTHLLTATQTSRNERDDARMDDSHPPGRRGSARYAATRSNVRPSAHHCPTYIPTPVHYHKHAPQLQ